MTTLNQQPKILVLGATGLLGTSLVPILRSIGCLAISHGHSVGADYQADLTQVQATHRLLDQIMPDVVINLAALTNVDQCEENPDLAYQLNSRVVENLASWSGFRKNSHLIQISTDHIYDGVGPCDESQVTIRNVYALSKYAGELAALKIGATVLRTNMFGTSQHPTRRSFSDWILDNLKAERSITVFDDVAFSPLSFNSLSRMIGLTARKKIGGVFNLGSTDGMSKADFAKALALANGLKTDGLQRGQSNTAQLKARRPKDMRMNSQKFEVAFGVTLPKLIDDIQGKEMFLAET